MAAYIHGNLARQEQQPLHRPKVKETRRVVVRNKALPMQDKLLILLAIAIGVIVGGVIIWRYAQIYQMNKTIYEIQTDIRALQAENNMLKEKIDRANDPNKLKEDAKQFGLLPLEEESKVLLPNRSGQAKSTDNKVAMKP